MIKNLIIRTLSGAVLAAVVIGAILLSHISMVMLAIVVAALSLLEFYSLISTDERRPAVGYSLFVGMVMVAMFYAAASGLMAVRYLMTIIPMMLILFFLELSSKSKEPFINISLSLCGLVYIALPFAMFASLPFVTVVGGTLYRPWVLLGVIFTVWANDVGAYLVGMSIGRHKMWPRLSPKKSWEGFVGGVVFAVGVALAMANYMGYDPVKWGFLGLLISITSVLGDIVESMLKRSLDVKDSGSIIPGHGGFLDRFDALILTIPFVYIYFIIFTL